MASALTQESQPGPLPEGSLGLGVTGVDAQGHVFRERTTVLSLDGRACKYKSKFEVQVDSWVLLDIDYSKASQEPSRVQGQVKSVLPPRTSDQLFQISVELEVAQTMRVAEKLADDHLVAQEPKDLEPQATAIQPERPAESASTQRAAAALPRPRVDKSTAGAAQGREQLSNPREQVLTVVRETARAAASAELGQHLETLRNWVSREVGRAVQEGAGSRLDQFLREAVEKYISENLQATIQAVNGDFANQLVTRLAGSEQLRASLTSAAEDLTARLDEFSQMTVRKTEEGLTARVVAIREVFEGSVAETQRKLDDLGANLEATLARAQAIEREAARSVLSLREALERFKEAGKIAAEEVEQGHAISLETRIAEFTKQLDGISVESTARFASEVEQRLMPHVRRADETIEKLATLLQLAQGTLRMQEERLAELSRTATANLEKEINALFLRLSGHA